MSNGFEAMSLVCLINKLLSNQNKAFQIWLNIFVFKGSKIGKI
jgi:hypothetical protein